MMYDMLEIQFTKPTVHAIKIDVGGKSSFRDCIKYWCFIKVKWSVISSKTSIKRLAIKTKQVKLKQDFY